MRIYFLPLLLLYLVPASAAEPPLIAKRLSESVYELLLVTDQTADAAVAQRVIWPAAQQLCAGKIPRFGHYKFQSSEPMLGQSAARKEITLRQEVHCDVAGMPSPRLTSPPAVPHDDGEIAELTNIYLTAKHTGRYAEAYKLFGPSMKDSTSLES